MPKALAISETINKLMKTGYPVCGGLIYINQQTGCVRDIEKYPELN